MEKMLNDLASINQSSVSINKFDFSNKWRAMLRIDTIPFKAEFVEEGYDPLSAVSALHKRVEHYFNRGMTELSMRLIEGPKAE